MSETDLNFTPYSGLVFDGSAVVFSGDSSFPRECRFCGLSEPEVSFDNDTAHSISESLGNSNFITNDECKSCNHYFSSIEQSFYRAHAPMLMLCGITGKDNGKRKNNVKSLAGGNCRINFSEKGLFIALNNEEFEKYKDEAQTKHIFNYDPILKFEKFKPIDIYKSLCKYVISILPKEDLKYFSTTKEWLLGQRSFEILPQIVTTHSQLTMHPIIGYFIRQRTSPSPFAVGFFRVALLTYFFIIPGANDEISYPKVEWLMAFADKLHNGQSVWYPKDLSSNKKEMPQMPIEINNIHLGVNCFMCDKDQLPM